MLTLSGETVEPESSSFLRNAAVCRDSFRAVLSLATTGAGMPAGPTSANQMLMSMPLSLGVSASAGISVVMGERLASVVPSATTLPLRICGNPLDSTNTPKSMLLPSKSLARGATPRYGMCVMNRPPWSFTISPARCRAVPTPELPKLYLPGFWATWRMNCSTVFTPELCEATSTIGWVAIRPMGVKSLMSYLTALDTRRVMAISLLAPTSSV